MTLTLRPATLDDVGQLQEWDRKPHVIDAGWNAELDWATEVGRVLPWRLFLIATVSDSSAEPDRSIGFIQIIDPALEETHYFGDVAPNLRAIDILIGDENELGRGYGTTMLRSALSFCFENPSVVAVIVDPLANNQRAHRFYERLGFVQAERRLIEGDDCIIYKLTRIQWRATERKPRRYRDAVLVPNAL